MTKVSRRLLSKELETHIFDLFTESIIDLKNKQDVSNFLEDLLSPSEKIMLVKRLAIAILLSKSYTYDMIDETLKVSRPTITHVSYWLKYGSNNGYKKVVEKIAQDKKKEVMFDAIETVLLKLSRPRKEKSRAFLKKQKQGKSLFERKRKRNLL